MHVFCLFAESPENECGFWDLFRLALFSVHHIWPNSKLIQKNCCTDQKHDMKQEWKLETIIDKIPFWIVCIFTCLHILQDSLDELEMDDYWKEVEQITCSGGGAGRGEGGGEGEVQEEEQQKIPEGKKHCVHGQAWKGDKLALFLHLLVCTGSPSICSGTFYFR